jgi:hypothetical protein
MSYQKKIWEYNLERSFSTPHIMPKAKVGTIPNPEGDKVEEISPTIHDIPPKTHTVGPSSVLWAPTTTLDPVFSINNLSPKRNLLLHVLSSIYLSLDKTGDQSRAQCKNII